MKRTLLYFFSMLSFVATQAQKSELFSVLFMQSSASIPADEQQRLKREMADFDLSTFKLELMPPIAYGPEAPLSKPRVEAVKTLLLGLGVPPDSVIILPPSTNKPYWRDLQANLDRKVLINAVVPFKYDLMKDWVVYAPQKFDANGGTSITVTGKDGTRIEFPANIFIDSQRRPVTDNIRIELIEFLKISDMLLNNLTTWSGRRILETSGMVHITAWRGSEMLSLAPGATYTITFPNTGDLTGYRTFYGSGHQNIDWTEGEASLASSKIVKDEMEDPDYDYYGLKVSRMMWINCDKFNDPAETSPLAVKVSGGGELRLYAVLKNSRSVLSCDADGNFGKLPKNEPVFIVATSGSKDKLFYGKTEAVPGKDATANLVVKPVSKAELDGAMTALDKELR